MKVNPNSINKIIFYSETSSLTLTSSNVSRFNVTLANPYVTFEGTHVRNVFTFSELELDFSTDEDCSILNRSSSIDKIYIDFETEGERVIVEASRDDFPDVYERYFGTTETNVAFFS